MQPPKQIDVLDQHNGFTCLTRTNGYDRHPFNPSGWVKRRKERGNTLWRPGAVLKHGTLGELKEFDEHSFFQTNNDVTKAIYVVSGYGFRVVCWFDNVTGNRIA